MKHVLLACTLLGVAGCAGSPMWVAQASDEEKRAFYGNRCTTLYGIPPEHPNFNECIMMEAHAGETRRMQAAQSMLMYGAISNMGAGMPRSPAQVVRW